MGLMIHLRVLTLFIFWVNGDLFERMCGLEHRNRINMNDGNFFENDLAIRSNNSENWWDLMVNDIVRAVTPGKRIQSVVRRDKVRAEERRGEPFLQTNPLGIFNMNEDSGLSDSVWSMFQRNNLEGGEIEAPEERQTVGYDETGASTGKDSNEGSPPSTVRHTLAEKLLKPAGNEAGWAQDVGEEMVSRVKAGGPLLLLAARPASPGVPALPILAHLIGSENTAKSILEIKATDIFNIPMPEVTTLTQSLLGQPLPREATQQGGGNPREHTFMERMNVTEGSMMEIDRMITAITGPQSGGASNKGLKVQGVKKNDTAAGGKQANMAKGLTTTTVGGMCSGNTVSGYEKFVEKLLEASQTEGNDGQTTTMESTATPILEERQPERLQSFRFS